MRESTRSWVEFAKRDLEGAKELLKNEYLANIVMFHSQQSVEKLLKSILEEHLIHIPRTHNLKKLYTLVPDQIVQKLNINENELDLIDQVYIDARYPADFGLLPSGIPTQDEANQLFKIAENISNQILNLYL
ncbi:MAG: HEPN domain-containing protein [Desulfobacterales bacterium]|nr:HEPN domain-containing protein [Desulfobacterales bacterium]